MAQLSLDILKKHVRAEEFDDDDRYLQALLEASTQAVLNETRRTRQEMLDKGGGEWPDPVAHAILLLAGHLYNQREAVSTTQMHEVPCGLTALILPYTKLTIK
ncbi:MAG: head-tail connector protein [Muribaculaceae bacterium]|nr:head-tail connector protein [Muribaculaceae bacterium]